MFVVMKTFLTDISASTGRNDFIFDNGTSHYAKVMYQK
jgi:hypothetical protein